MTWRAKRSVLTLHKKIAKRDREELEAARMRGDFHPHLSLSEKLAGALAKSFGR
jgi:hypothetical protein